MGLGVELTISPNVKPYCLATPTVIAARKMVRISRDISFLTYQSFWDREVKETENLCWNGMAFVVKGDTKKGTFWKKQQKLKISKKKNLLTEIEPLQLAF